MKTILISGAAGRTDHSSKLQFDSGPMVIDGHFDRVDDRQSVRQKNDSTSSPTDGTMV